MTLSPGYGETPIDGDEFEALLPAVREALGDEPTKAAVYDLEQAVQIEIGEALLTAVLDGSLRLDELLTDQFVRELHLRLFGDIWAAMSNCSDSTMRTGTRTCLPSSSTYEPSTKSDSTTAPDRLALPLQSM